MFLLVRCAHGPLDDPREALRETEMEFAAETDTDVAGVEALLMSALAYFDGAGEAANVTFGELRITGSDYRLALEYLLGELKRDPLRFRDVISEGFTAYEAYGGKSWGEVEVAGITLPKVRAARAREALFSRPLYSPPRDLVRIRFPEYSRKFPTLAALPDANGDGSEITYGRFKASPDRREAPSVIEPYASRKEIESQRLLSGKGLELAWLRPEDEAIVTDLGLAELDFGNESPVFVSEVATNGRKRTAKEEFFAFFRVSRELPHSRLGAPYVNGRVLAADYRYYPKGALALLMPLAEDSSQDPLRFVGTLEATRDPLGTAKTTLFLGTQGSRASLVHPARLVFLAPKQSLLDRLRRDFAGKAASQQ